ncbi:VWA domain-containing protein [Anaerobacillus sp. CMMVII]|uniref:vWA domain-containing protein n=1 Tax=Anaerobacillus sp. CMMVII TaxID=2755588 RepID=UPI0021B8211A|nr:VWA domain-containing protein [Anaerobacillus sp. CMMVII]MCT8136507.1 VWA domain-containing protein [Anaerobacillus sp. CMMVII]
MGILVPAFLGLSIFIGGVVLFYMFRKQYTEQVISSNLLWEQVMNEWQATTWWKKLQRQLLLLLQILILLFLMLALARPFFTADGLEGDHVIILLDSSASMTTTIDQDGTTRFEQAKKEISGLIDKRSRSQAVSIISIASTPTLVVNREIDQRVMKDALEEITISYEYSEIQRALSLAKALSEQQASSIYVFSDQMTEEHFIESQINSPFHVVNIAGENDRNISIMTFGVNTSRAGALGVVTLRNESSEEQLVTIQVMADGELVHTETVQMEATTQAYLTIGALPPATYYTAKIIEDDIYPLDNVAYSFSSIEVKPVLYLLGDINPFLHKVFLQLGNDIIQAEKIEDVHEFAKNSIVIASETEQVFEVGRPLFLLPSAEGEGIPLEKKVEIKSNDELFSYADVEEIYISQAQSQVSQSVSLVDTVMFSGDIPLIQKGYKNGLPFVQLLFDIQDSDWPLHFSFPIFIYHSLEYLKGESTHFGYFQPNEERALQLETAGMYSVIDETEEVIATFDRDNDFFRAPNKPGLYSLVDSEGNIKRFAVILDEREKETQAYQSFSKQGKETTMETGTVQYEWWPWLLLIAFIILLVEWEVYRRGIRA